MNERRRPKRYPRRLTVRFGEGDRLDRTGFTTDISVTGIFVVAPTTPPPIDTRIHVQLMLEGGRHLFLEGVVRRHKTPPRELQAMEHRGFGVRFLSSEELLGEMVPKAVPTDKELVPDTSQVNVKQLQADAPKSGIHRSPDAIAEGSVIGVTQVDEPKTPVFEVRYPTKQDLKASWDRELKLGGVFVKTDWVVTAQQEVILRFVLEFANTKVECRSRVLAITPTGVAFGFDKAKIAADLAAHITP